MRTLMILTALAAGAASPAMAADGAALFAARCASCHTVTGASGPGGARLGGVVGRKIASLTDYAYSPALKGKAGRWTAKSLDAYLAAPSTFAPGTKMFVSVADPATRSAVISYLSGLK